jgi:hypothetical protein
MVKSIQSYRVERYSRDVQPAHHVLYKLRAFLAAELSSFFGTTEEWFENNITPENQLNWSLICKMAKVKKFLPHDWSIFCTLSKNMTSWWYFLLIKSHTPSTSISKFPTLRWITALISLKRQQKASSRFQEEFFILNQWLHWKSQETSQNPLSCQIYKLS